MLAMMVLQFFHAFRPKRLVLTFHGSEILRFARNPFTRWLGRRLIQRATRISTLSTYTQELLCTHFPEAEAKTFLTPGALPRRVYAVVPGHPRRAPGKTVILTVGRLHPRKGRAAHARGLAGHGGRISPPDPEYWLVGSHSKKQKTSEPGCCAPRRPGGGFSRALFWGRARRRTRADLPRGTTIFAMTSINHGNSIEGFGLRNHLEGRGAWLARHRAYRRRRQRGSRRRRDGIAGPAPPAGTADRGV